MSNKFVKGPVETPLLLQLEAVECGAAALGIILGYHGRFIPLEQLRIECGVSRDGSKASNVINVGRDHGMKCEGHSRTLEEMRTLNVPCILFWEFNHFLVFEGFKNGKYYLNDPAFGRRLVEEQEFSEAFTGITLEFEKGADFLPLGKPYKVVNDIRKWVKGFERPLLLIVILGSMLSVPMVLVPLLSRFYIDLILIQGNVEWMPLLIIAILMTTGVIVVLELMKKNILRRLQVKLAVKLGYVFISRLFRLPMQFFLQRDKAEIVARAELCDTAARHIAGPLTLFFVSAINLVLFAATLLLFQPILALIAIISAIVVVLFLTLVARSSVNPFIRYKKERSALIGFSINGVSLIETIKATGMESEYFERWSGHFAKMHNAEFEVGRFAIKRTLIPLSLSLFTTIAILYAGSHMVVSGAITIGGLVGVIALSQCFASSLIAMAEFSNCFPELSACFNSMNDILNYSETLALDKIPAVEKEEENELHVTIRNVTFGYITRAKPTISDVNIELERHKSVALVGRSGSGKSTIAKLVSGLYSQWSGDVLLDGEPITNYDAKELSRKIAVVEQQTRLFSGTVRDNLVLWNDRSVTDEEIVIACKMVGIHEEIMDKPMGYLYDLEENGRNISGGQRQRIELARCILRKPELLILDEATSALDEATEKLVMENILSLGITVLVIAHRLSTIVTCDNIVVFDKGEIVERGTHEQLLKKNGIYYNLVNTQDTQ